MLAFGVSLDGSNLAPLPLAKFLLIHRPKTHQDITYHTPNTQRVLRTHMADEHTLCHCEAHSSMEAGQ